MGAVVCVAGSGVAACVASGVWLPWRYGVSKVPVCVAEVCGPGGE